MRIVVDMDEVLAQFIKKTLHRWNSINGTSFTREDITCWRMENVLGRDITGRSADGLIDEWLAEPGYYEDLEPLPGAIESVQQLMDRGHDIVIATSVPEVALHAYDGKRKWMRRYFPKWSMKSFIASSRKGLVGGDILIDDGGHNITDWCAQGKTGGFLFDAPWNRDVGQRIQVSNKQKEVEVVHGIPFTRVYDWQDIMYQIEKFAYGRKRIQ